ncbi:hypothetical protein [Robbsia andropogonis]|uniref:hypothetical protein n=1 Tax=Robbsia andropogonis TaxID=28092 RepID=UPI00209F6BBA|nr:hypothetical protein [Robbsia andropogonis]MCP1117015.1 hypothetical protein [Robbsia andropogonis]MCP1126306.1 hypothetical protein [Robbsia andropogonis]
MDNDAFYLVWCPSGVKPPSFRHLSKQSAVQEAERLAATTPGAEFYVLCAQSMRKVDSMQRVELIESDIPF